MKAAFTPSYSATSINQWKHAAINRSQSGDTCGERQTERKGRNHSSKVTIVKTRREAKTLKLDNSVENQLTVEPVHFSRIGDNVYGNR